MSEIAGEQETPFWFHGDSGPYSCQGRWPLTCLSFELGIIRNDPSFNRKGVTSPEMICGRLRGLGLELTDTRAWYRSFIIYEVTLTINKYEEASTSSSCGPHSTELEGNVLSIYILELPLVIHSSLVNNSESINQMQAAKWEVKHVLIQASKGRKRPLHRADTLL